jgi:hypothetical protein
MREVGTSSLWWSGLSTAAVTRQSNSSESIGAEQYS